MEEIARTTLNASELKSGFMYIFWSDSNPGLLHIGFTHESIEKRIAHRSYQCEHQFTFRPRLYKGSTMWVPSVRRVGRLIHAELQGSRVTVGCQGCDMKHSEWFRVSERKALETFQKWKNWILDYPYGPIDLISRSTDPQAPDQRKTRRHQLPSITLPEEHQQSRAHKVQDNEVKVIKMFGKAMSTTRELESNEV